MIVSKDSFSVFEPLYIKIESEDEARALWHILNCPFGVSLQDYLIENQAPKNLNKTGGKMFRLLNELYVPTEDL